MSPSAAAARTACSPSSPAMPMPESSATPTPPCKRALRTTPSCASSRPSRSGPAPCPLNSSSTVADDLRGVGQAASQGHSLPDPAAPLRQDAAGPAGRPRRPVEAGAPDQCRSPLPHPTYPRKHRAATPLPRPAPPDRGGRPGPPGSDLAADQPARRTGRCPRRPLRPSHGHRERHRRVHRVLHMDALSAAVPLKIDADLQFTVMAATLYRLLARRIGHQHERTKAQQLFDRFVRTSATVRIGPEVIEVRLGRRAHNRCSLPPDSARKSSRSRGLPTENSGSSSGTTNQNNHIRICCWESRLGQCICPSKRLGVCFAKHNNWAPQGTDVRRDHRSRCVEDRCIDPSHMELTPLRRIRGRDTYRAASLMT